MEEEGRVVWDEEEKKDKLINNSTPIKSIHFIDLMELIVVEERVD